MADSDAKRNRTPVKSQHNVMGLVHPYRPEYKVWGKVQTGTTVYSAIRQACGTAKVRRKLLRYGVAQVGRRNYEKQVTEWRFIPFSQWKKYRLAEDELLRFRILPKGGGGGGGGKTAGILGIVVAVAAIAAAVFTSGLSVFAAGGALAGYGGVAAGMAVLTIGQALVNAIAPVAAPSSLGSFSSMTQSKEADVYSISAGRNSINQWGRVPVPVGRGRFAPPKGASSYTELKGEDQYLHELFCLGIGNMQFSQIKIGSTPIENYNEALYEIMTYNPKSPRAPKYYPTGVYEETLNVQLKKNENNIRMTNECDYAEIDLSFNGLCWLNEQGNPERTGVDFNIQYRGSGSGGGSTEWTTEGMPRYIDGKSNWHPAEMGERYLLGVNMNGIFSRMGATEVKDGEAQLGFITYTREIEEWQQDDVHNASNDTWMTVYYKKISDIYTFEEDRKAKGVRIDGFDVTVNNGYTEVDSQSNLWWENSFPRKGGVNISGGNIVVSGDTKTFRARSEVVTYRVEGAQTRLLRNTYTIRFPKRGVYAISITRTTDDSDDTRLKNESYWTALRSMTNDLPVQTEYPVMLLSLQIKATGQLSGAIDTLTVYYETKCLDYDISRRRWVTRYSSNPAAIFRYILQQKDAFDRAQPDSALDLPSIEEAYKFYSQKAFGYDKVMDTSVSIFERLISICASALSSPTMLEGKWGIIVDKPRTNVVCAFTSANAWNWSFERKQIRLPHAIHCNFINEETWDADMRVVNTDEPYSSNYLFETQEYDGVVSPKQVYLLARFHYADAKMRRRTISFTAFDESILCTRGDLVELACPNISVQGLQVGRVRKINTDKDGNVTSITTDQINTTDNSGRKFGVRIYANDGSIFIAEVKAENKSQRLLTFKTPQAMKIQKGNKYAFGDYREEAFQAVVVSMKFNADWTCEISCTDYIPAIYGDLSKPIPDWTSIITKPIEYKWMLSSVPVIIRIVSDETAIVRGSDGTLQCRMLVYLNDPRNIDPKAVYYNCEIREVQDDSDPADVLYSPWASAARGVPIEQSQFYINDVNEGQKYQIRVRYTGLAGEYGEWGEIVEHTIVGKTSRPPDVTNFRAEIDNPNGIKLTWDMLKILDIAHYRIGGDSQNTVLASPSIEKVYRKTGTLNFNIVAVDTGGRTSLHPAEASVEVLAPKIPVIESAQLLNHGIVMKWLDASTTWDIARYILSSLGITVNMEGLEGTIPFTGDFPIGAYANMSCVDIFDNPCVGNSSRMITVYYPQTPDISVGFNKLNGMVTLDWQDCRNKEVENAPAIDHYEVSGTLSMGKPAIVKGNHYESIVPLVVYEFGAGSVEGGIAVNVGNLHIKVNSVDKYGIRSDQSPSYVSNEKNIAIYPPYNPTDFGVSASLTTGENLDANWTEATAIMLTWRDCERTFKIDYYIVHDFHTNTQYKVATNYVVLPARKEGSYRLTVQAFDVLGLESANMEYHLNIAGVGGMEVKSRLEGGDILLEWDTPPASFQIDHYIIFEDNDDLPEGNNSDLTKAGYAGQAKFNYFRIPAKQTGSFTFYVWAVDVAGNINTHFANYTTIAINANPAPSITAEVKDNGVGLAWTIASKPADTLPVSVWEIRRYARLTGADQIPLNTPLEDYGQIDADKLNVAAFKVGKYSFAVRAIDSGGNAGEWGLCDFAVSAPGQVTFVNQVVIDNNVQLYWSDPNYIFFPIKEYVFEEVDKDTGIHMLIGTVDAQFASEVEEVAGEYTYAITPVDWGGNRGQTNTITLRVSQPPDFVFYDRKESLFNGTKTNLVLDGKGHMLGPVPVGETWQQNVTRMGQLAGTAITTHQQKINKGWKYWLQPEVSTGTYVEVIDHGAIVPSSNYRVTIGWVGLSGNPNITCKIEVSEDGKTWRLAANNATSVYITQYRYSRITLTVTDGYVQINNIEVNLNVKKLTDFGRVTSKSTDNGAGWTSESATPMLTGTWVPFKVDFVDVQSLPRPNVVVTSSAQSGYTAFTVFEDVLNPKGFRVFVKDKNGTRVTADVDWVAMGV